MIDISVKTTADGFVTTDDVDYLAAIAKALNDINASANARLLHTGGGIFGVEVDLAGRHGAVFGIVDGILAGDIHDAEGFIDSTTLPWVDGTPAAVVAQEISKFVNDYAATGHVCPN